MTRRHKWGTVGRGSCGARPRCLQKVATPAKRVWGIESGKSRCWFSSSNAKDSFLASVVVVVTGVIVLVEAVEAGAKVVDTESATSTPLQIIAKLSNTPITNRFTTSSNPVDTSRHTTFLAIVPPNLKPSYWSTSPWCKRHCNWNPQTQIWHRRNGQGAMLVNCHQDGLFLAHSHKINDR